MTDAEKVEMLELRIEHVYREHFRVFGPVWRREMEGPELAALWAEWEVLVG